jgi:hypothetical protein
VPLDDEAKALKLEQTKADSRKAIAEAEKAIAEAQKATLAAKLPTTAAVTPLEGKIEVDAKTGLIADLLAHSLLGDAAKEIAAQVESQTDKTSVILVVEDRALTKTDWPYEAIRKQVAQQDEALTEVLGLFGEEGRVPPPEPRAELLPELALSAVPSTVNALASVLGMFQSDYAITSRDVTIGNTPLVAAVAGELAAARKVTVSGFELVGESEVAKKFWDAWGKRGKLERLKVVVTNRDIKPVELRIEDQRSALKQTSAALDKELGADDADRDALARLRKRIADLQSATAADETSIGPKRAQAAAADAAIARFDAFATAVTTTSAEAAYPPLVAAAIQERLREGTSRITDVLFVGLEAASGEVIRRRNLFLWPKLSFVGGVQVSRLLFNVARKLTVASGTQSLVGQIKYNPFTGKLARRWAEPIGPSGAPAPAGEPPAIHPDDPRF